MCDEAPKDLREVQPSSFRHVIGNAHVTQALQIACQASFAEGKRVDEILLCGPAGCGKTSLVAVLAQELAVPFTEVLAQSITTAAELNAMLLGMSEHEPGGILFLDEIHLLHPTIQHLLLTVLDKRRIYVNGGKSVQSIPVSEFSLVGATTDLDSRIISPLVDRFRIILHLDYYSLDELAQIVRQRCHAMGWKYDPLLPSEIAQRGRQVPRIAIRLLCSSQRVAVSEGAKEINVAHLLKACEIERISTMGLDNMQQKYLRLLAGAGQRLNVLASMLGVSTKVVATLEPFLLRSGLVVKTDAGLRQLTQEGRQHLDTLQPETV